MTIRTAVLARNAELEALAALLDGGSLEVRTGSQPADPESSATGILLATLTLNTPAFWPAAEGVIKARPIGDDPSAAAAGRAGWFRARTADGAPIFDGSVSGIGGAGDAMINSVSIQLGARVRLTSLTFSLPT